MKIHIITVGKPKLPYARAGWEEYLARLKKLHDVRITHLADKHADDTGRLLAAAGAGYKVALVIDAPEKDSEQLADLLKDKALEGREVTWLVGGPDGLPASVIEACDLQLGLSKLTFPHDLAMVVLAEALYRASTINAGSPYHH
jgi:23S rRNA (pseudouridine1915-N3)-methyltransferase